MFYISKTLVFRVSSETVRGYLSILLRKYRMQFQVDNDVIFEIDCNQPSSCINPLISEISVPEIKR